MTRQSKDIILQQQEEYKRLGLDFVPYDEMLSAQEHLIDGYRAITTCSGASGMPCGYIGVREGHPLYGLSYQDADKLAGDDAEFELVYGGFTPNDYTVLNNDNANTKELWLFGIDTGLELEATRQDLIEILRDVAKFLNSRIGENNKVN